MSIKINGKKVTINGEEFDVDNPDHQALLRKLNIDLDATLDGISIGIDKLYERIDQSIHRASKNLDRQFDNISRSFDEINDIVNRRHLRKPTPPSDRFTNTTKQRSTLRTLRMWLFVSLIGFFMALLISILGSSDDPKITTKPQPLQAEKTIEVEELKKL